MSLAFSGFFTVFMTYVSVIEPALTRHALALQSHVTSCSFLSTPPDGAVLCPRAAVKTTGKWAAIRVFGKGHKHVLSYTTDMCGIILLRSYFLFLFAIQIFLTFSSCFHDVCPSYHVCFRATSAFFSQTTR